jgi:hypothetical protein
MLPKIHRLFVNEELQLFRQLGAIPMASIISSLVTPSLWLVSKWYFTQSSQRKTAEASPRSSFVLHLVLRSIGVSRLKMRFTILLLSANNFRSF